MLSAGGFSVHVKCVQLSSALQYFCKTACHDKNVTLGVLEVPVQLMNFFFCARILCAMNVYKSLGHKVLF
jgi:hypothetical protein